MYGHFLPNKPKRVLVLGSGALQIGQAGEFDYSGSQALKALKEEGIYNVLINPNIATIQTSHELADQIYLLPVEPEFVEEIIVKEQIDSILLSFGGQTALNCAIKLDDAGVFEKHGVSVLGTPLEAIRNTEDRHLFKHELDEIGVLTARSVACEDVETAREAAGTIGLPVMLRSAYSLGGKGSGIVETADELDTALIRAFDGGVRQVLVEECLRGWKEIEYEVVRDNRDSCITVCNMENFDPLGIHTGESIVVAPSQTLNDHEHQMLRTISIRTIRHLGIVGECNIQFALDPNTTDYRVIEVNARLSRSSALASKATGYPLAYVAAKIAIGYALPDIPNGVTRRTCCLFEPALDYIVCKFPRWDLTKFEGASTLIGSEMKSVGEVMAIGRTFPEAIQKAVRMLDIGVEGPDHNIFDYSGELGDTAMPTPLRIFAITAALGNQVSVEDIHKITAIDRWFLYALAEIVGCAKSIAPGCVLDADKIRKAKRLGFSDQRIEALAELNPGSVRELRGVHGIQPGIAQIDTLAAEFPAETNYLYTSYHSSEISRPGNDDLQRARPKSIMVLGSGAYRIGSSVEFDWCAVNAINGAAELGYESIMVNYNPETVSTDFDVCDKLYFDELSLESVLEIYEHEQPVGVILCMGGQIPNNLALQLHGAGVRVLGTCPEKIDTAEDRQKFSTLLDELEIDQPKWFQVTDIETADSAVEGLGGFPVLVRPSYVLSGAAMSVAHEPNELRRILARATTISNDHPVVVSKFETHAREIEIDAVADQGEMVLWAISEHVEDAGVHSGDATLVLPPQTLYITTIRKVRQIAAAVAKALTITGPFNMQFLAKHNAVKVIECNLRASRSLPFVSKIVGTNYAREATRRMLGVADPVENHSLDLDYVGVKVPMFSFSRLVGADPLAGVEMRSTGEVGCIGDDLHEALLKGMLATGFRIPQKGVLLSLGPVEDKFWFSDEARSIVNELKLPIYATSGTAKMLEEIGVPCKLVGRHPDEIKNQPSAQEIIEDGLIDLVINVPKQYDNLGRPDGYFIRRRSIDAGIPLITDRQLARAIIEALRTHGHRDLMVLPWKDYLSTRNLSHGLT